MKINTEEVVIEFDWPINVASLCVDDDIEVWMAWCAKSSGDSKCICYPNTPVAFGDTREEVLEFWHNQHFPIIAYKMRDEQGETVGVDLSGFGLPL